MEKLQVTLTFGNCEVNIQQQGNDVHKFTKMVRQLIAQITQVPSTHEDDDMVKSNDPYDEVEYDRLSDK